MITRIYKTQDEFDQRVDKRENGVSPQFAKDYADWESSSHTSQGCWDCLNCKNCRNCWNCRDCTKCRDCASCDGCRVCFLCFACYECVSCRLANSEREQFKFNCKVPIPVIKNIHAAVAKVTKPVSALCMTSWHRCETTHCRAGWVVTLAGAAGEDLENRVGTNFAAQLIYKASSPIRVPMSAFFEGRTIALQHIRQCAREEAKQAKAAKKDCK